MERARQRYMSYRCAYLIILLEHLVRLTRSQHSRPECVQIRQRFSYCPPLQLLGSVVPRMAHQIARLPREKKTAYQFPCTRIVCCV